LAEKNPNIKIFSSDRSNHVPHDIWGSGSIRCRAGVERRLRVDVTSPSRHGSTHR